MHDVVIVGAGISGLRCAEILANAGLDVVVLEKKETYGGSFGENMEAFPEYHYSRLDLRVPSKPVNEVKVFCGDGARKRELVIRFEGPVFRIVKRGAATDSIDCYLYERALKASAKIRFGTKFEKVRPGSYENHLQISTSSGDSFESKVLIATDGVFSTVRKSCGVTSNQKTEGIGYIAKVEGARLSKSEIVGIFNYSRWPGSYCYLIGYPEDNFTTVGIAVRPPYANNVLKKYFDSLTDYLPEILGGIRVVDLTRGFVTIGSRDRPLAASVGSTGVDNVLFVGEAGGFQDLTLAFGLAPALISARFAATSVTEAVNKNNPGLLNNYATRARRELVRDESRRLSFRYILESISEDELSQFLAVIANDPAKVERVMKTGEYIYNFLPLILRSASRNPRILTLPLRFASVSRSLKKRQSSLRNR